MWCVFESLNMYLKFYSQIMTSVNVLTYIKILLTIKILLMSNSGNLILYDLQFLYKI